MLTNDKTNLYDSIDSIAVRWLTWNADVHKSALCIQNIDIKNETHLWLLEIFRNYSIINSYCTYYIEKNFFLYLYLKYIKKHKHLSFYKFKKEILTIDFNIFTKEITEYFNVDINTLKEIYNLYYRR